MRTLHKSSFTAALLTATVLLSHGIHSSHGFVSPTVTGINKCGARHSCQTSMAARAAIETGVSKPQVSVNDTSDTKATVKRRSKKYVVRRWKSLRAESKRTKAKMSNSESVNSVGLSLEWGPEVNTSVKNAKRKQHHSKAAHKKNKQTRSKLSFDSLAPGTMLSGKVVKVLPYGALVKTEYDIPGKTRRLALLHKSQISDKKIHSISEFVEVGQVIKNARVLSLNREAGKVALTLRPRTTRTTTLESINVGDEIEGKVVRLKNYGAFVDIGCKRNGLLHISRMSMYKVEDIADYVQVGQTVRVRVIRIDPDNNDIAVSMLSPAIDKFVDRRDREKERMTLWRKVVDGEGNGMEEAKRQLVDLNQEIWDEMQSRIGKPRKLEV